MCCDQKTRAASVQTGPDLPVGYIDLKPRAADSRGPPVNCGTHRESVYYQFD